MLFFALFVSASAAINPSKYPALDKVPPANATWTAVFGDNVPQLPPSGQLGLPHPNLNLGHTSCLGPKVYGLSYDDGPSNSTLALLDELKARNLKATFFVVGSRVISRPKVLQRAYREGHQIALHTWSHPPLTSISDGQIIAEILWNAKAVRDVIGVTPTYIRPPFGDADGRVVAIARNMGLTIVNWLVDSQDTWTKGLKDVAGVLRNYTAANPNVSPIGLHHDLFSKQVLAAPAALDMLIESNYTIKTIADCLESPTPMYSDRIWDDILRYVPPPTATTTASTETSTTNASTETSSAAVSEHNDSSNPTIPDQADSFAQPPPASTPKNAAVHLNGNSYLASAISFASIAVFSAFAF